MMIDDYLLKTTKDCFEIYFSFRQLSDFKGLMHKKSPLSEQA
jgi:hypothetical protein